MKSFAIFFGALGAVFVLFGAVSSALFIGASGVYQAIGLAQMVLGIAGIGIFLFYFFGDALQTLSRRRETIFGILGGLLILFILIGANVVAHSQFGERKIDTTANKLHSLSPESVELIKKSPAKISIVAFLQPQHEQIEQLKDLVKKYTYVTDKLSFQVADPDKEPQLLQSYDAHADEIVVRNETTKKSVKLTAVSEQELSSAIKRVMAAESKVAYFLQGHGEGDLEDDKTGAGIYIPKLLLENEGFKVLALNLSTAPEIPKDAAMVFAWGAQRSFASKEVDLLSNYVDRGGNLVIAQDPLISPAKDRLTPSGLEPLLDKFGLQFNNAIVLEHQLQLLRGKVINAKLALTDFGKHSIVSKLNKQSMAEFFVAQPVVQKSDYKGPATRETLVTSGPNSWAETDIGSIFVSQKPAHQSDVKGGIPLAQAAEIPVADTVKDRISPKGKLVVFGDADFGANGLIQSGYNRDIVLNTANFLAGEETSMSIRPKTWTTSTLDITPDQMKLVSYASIFVMPQLILLAGIMIWLVRRARSGPLPTLAKAA